MPAKHSRHIALTGPRAEWIDARVAKGKYTSVRDVIRAARRLLPAQDEGRGEVSPAAPGQPAQPHERV
ncbi:type II toxin-antitoxin system ParD family antitoxin [Methylobacterium sp. J-070]|uniref:ribbon-helix-helix domain-containing protein n=1 Tax=Methylobacterium sp. J-070 TaxID=2836650 RepID=UPI001FBA4909|nr:type II toxin-antitoxin system ParD family antitoxin [Methylobacterium sp. J-070]MCJ2054877.1 type II toxin-antitoxin system ParD family antitoxin [Methylobacterium sp. J-070]